MGASASRTRLPSPSALPTTKALASAGARRRHQASTVSCPCRTIPVRLLYHNVFVDQHGGLAFRTDPYDWNPAVATALGFGEGTHMKAKADPIDVGP